MSPQGSMGLTCTDKDWMNEHLLSYCLNKMFGLFAELAYYSWLCVLFMLNPCHQMRWHQYWSEGFPSSPTWFILIVFVVTLAHSGLPFDTLHPNVWCWNINCVMSGQVRSLFLSWWPNMGLAAALANSVEFIVNTWTKWRVENIATCIIFWDRVY